MTVDVDTGSLLDAVDDFGARAEQRLFGVERPDGDLDAVDELIDQAGRTGLLADLDPEAGWYGVWGGHLEGDGTAFSLGVLRRLGRVCAGLAVAVHAQGLGIRLLGATGASIGWEPGARIAAGFSPPTGIALDPRAFDDGPTLVDGRLGGTVRFVLCAGVADGVVLAARAAGERALVALPVGAAGLRMEPTGPRIGLRAAAMADVVAHGVPVASDAVVGTAAEADERLARVCGLDWLGQAAVALGCAERAVADARAYTETRFQGGAAIAEHAAIRLLLGRAEHDLAVVEAVLDRHAATPVADLDSTSLLRWALDARLAAGEHASRAVTDALQTLGGYGYMDEYGLSKRLRDVTALRVLHGSPDQLVLARQRLTRERMEGTDDHR